MEKRCDVYIRYSDDILIFGKSKEELENLKQVMVLLLEKLGLTLNEEKTIICSLEKGVTFLGYELSREGKAIPATVERSLGERLEDV